MLHSSHHDVTGYLVEYDSHIWNTYRLAKLKVFCLIFALVFLNFWYIYCSICGLSLCCWFICEAVCMRCLWLSCSQSSRRSSTFVTLTALRCLSDVDSGISTKTNTLVQNITCKSRLSQMANLSVSSEKSFRKLHTVAVEIWCGGLVMVPRVQLWCCLWY